MDWKGIAVTDGSEQQDRQSAALQPDYFNVDELSFEALLAMGSEFASVIDFPTLKNEIDGNWGELFRADEAVIMALILSIDLKKLEADFLRISTSDTVKLHGFLLDLAQQIDLWFSQLSSCQQQSAQLLAHRIAGQIDERLAAELQQLYRIFGARETSPLAINAEEFASVWRLSEFTKADPVEQSTDSDAIFGKETIQQLKTSFSVFSNSISYLKQSTAILLQQSLNSGMHDPAIGLFIVFIRLYQKAQKKLNTFTSRHLDLYYQQILRCKKRKPVAKSYYLLLEPQPRSERIWVEPGTKFSAGKDSELNEIIYRNDEGLLLSDARVASLATLYLQHDSLISPESGLGYVTRMKSATPALASAEESQQPLWSLFGAEHAGMKEVTDSDASIGFSIASSLLLLEQGQRNIDMAIEIEPEQNGDLDMQLENLLQSDSINNFKHQFSALFARYLLTFKGGLTSQQKAQIFDKAESLLPERQLQEFTSLLYQDWQGLFYRLLSEAFSISLTSEEGWLDVLDYKLLPYSETTSVKKTGLRIQISLGQELPSVTNYCEAVHGLGLHSELPVMRCVINPLSHFYPYSVFQGLTIAALQLSVDVSGINKLLAYNQHGQLDPSKPFQPFGPLPGDSSYFVFGNYEVASKPLNELTLNLDWAELPRDSEGFEGYYRGYQTQFTNNAFKAAFSVLADSHWQPGDPADRDCFELFQSVSGTNSLLTTSVLRIIQLEASKPIDSRISEASYEFGLGARNGFFQLSLSDPAQAFGHAEYPALLTQILTVNARIKKPKALPNPPYTPTLNGLSLGYKASRTIKPMQQLDEITGHNDQIFQMHPFGSEAIYPAVADKPCYLMPQYEHQGNLFIGLSAKNLSGPLSLLFRLSEQMLQQTISTTNGFDWYYLSQDCWKQLPPNRVLSDTTYGFIASGRVSLDLPSDIRIGNSVMPGEYFWLRVSTRDGAGLFAGCYTIHCNALKVTHEINPEIDAEESPASPIKWTAERKLPGEGSIKQGGAGFGGRSRESDRQYNTRIAERLRHKNRALLPWDYEQLILERFPEVFLVKCFNSMSAKDNAIRPGQVLIVVVPERSTQAEEGCTGGMFNLQKLQQINSYVSNLSSPFASIEVCNPHYEKIQLRCSVRFNDSMSEGVNINRLNQQVSDYICPWNKTGYQARFGWSIRQQDIESYIRSLSYVDFVTNFSLLHITVDRHGNYSLFDSVKDVSKKLAVIRPHYPWSLALPAEQHFIETLSRARSIPAEITGVDELAVGSTFIISGSIGHGEKE